MFDDKADLYGISSMIRTDDIDSVIDLEDLEKKVMSGNIIVENTKETTAQKHDIDINKIIEGNNSETFDIEEKLIKFNLRDRESNGSLDGYDNKSYYSDARVSDRNADVQSDQYYPKFHDKEGKRNFFKHKTKEEERAKALKQYLHGDDDGNDQEDKYNIGPERLEDDKIVMIQQIET